MEQTWQNIAGCSIGGTCETTDYTDLARRLTDKARDFPQMMKSCFKPSKSVMCIVISMLAAFSKILFHFFNTQRMQINQRLFPGICSMQYFG